MFERSAAWNEYYRELDPPRRGALLEALRADEPDDGANAYRYQLLKARHADKRQPDFAVDHFLYNCISFIQLSQSARLFRGHAARVVARAVKDMCFDEARALGEAGESALYWELRNTAMRYFESCDNEGYNRQLFGLLASSEEARRDRLCRDVWGMTRGVSRFTGMEAVLEPWNRAVLDAYFSLDREARPRFEAYDRKQRGEG